MVQEWALSETPSPLTSIISGHQSQTIKPRVCGRVKTPMSKLLRLHALDAIKMAAPPPPFSFSELMLQRFHPPPAALCFSSTPLFGADIPTHHWSSHRTNGNPPACWNYWWLSPSLPPPPPTSLLTSIRSLSLLPPSAILHQPPLRFHCAGLKIYILLVLFPHIYLYVHILWPIMLLRV